MRRGLAGFGMVLAGMLFAAVGCGDGKVSVQVKVTKDGAALAGAAVTFQAGTTTPWSGVTDAGGLATIAAPPGDYKVTVSKTETAGEGVDAKGSMDMMKKMMMGNKGAKGAAKAAAKSLVPEQYTQLDKTPFSVKVPPASSPVVLDIK